MSQGLFSAISGIKSAQDSISVISDNIANMNTSGFKASQVTFENVFSRTLSMGTAPTSNMGGTNPIQVGLGTAIGDISRNFTSGTIQSTNRASDLNIQGAGFFCVMNPDGATMLTRAGNFTLDSNGNLVSAKGYRVIGTDQVFSNEGGSTTVKVPPALRMTVDANTNAVMGAKELANLNNAQITEGTFTLTTTYDDDGIVGTAPVTDTYTYTIDSDTTLDQMVTDINAHYDGLIAAADRAKVTASVANGKFSLAYDTNAGVGAVSTFTMTAGTSNFLSETQLSSATGSTTAGVTTLASKVLDYKATVQPPDVITESKVLTAFSIGTDGSIEGTYSNGDKISVTMNSDGTQKELIYKTSTGVTITNSDITVLGSVIEPANLQVQLATVVNTKGLVSEGGNFFSIGPNAGDPTFSVANANSMGSINSGGLESSNVDLPSEFAAMILAQRAMEASSRTFDTQNQIMQRLVNLGR